MPASIFSSMPSTPDWNLPLPIYSQLKKLLKYVILSNCRERRISAILKRPLWMGEILRRGVYPAKSPTEGSGERSRSDTQNDIGHDTLIIKFWIAILSVEDS